MSAHGMAGWVGQEFSGRTTANGEVFDPMLMTAAHRTLPFGTLLDVRNPKTGQTVRVRVNDRGPYVGDRLIDLSYAAAQQIGLDESGGGEIDMTVVKVGRGDREPPVPFAVNVPQSTNVTAIPPAPTPAPAPAPVQPRPAPAPAPAPATVDSVQVTEQHAATVETRRQVAASGTSMVDVPVTSTPLPAPAPAPSTAHATPAHTATAPSSKTTQPAKPTPQPKTQPATTQPATSSSTTTQTHTATSGTGHYVVQVGAFAQEGRRHSTGSGRNQRAFSHCPQNERDGTQWYTRRFASRRGARE